MNLDVIISTAQDGNMYNRHNDTDTNIIHNREVFLRTINSDLKSCVRVHVNALVRAQELHETNWCRYREVGPENAGQGMTNSDVTYADALITSSPGLAIMLPVADCIGAVIYDPDNRVMMVSHLGRHSLEQDGAVRNVEHLSSVYASVPSNLKIWMTPAAGQENFPIWALSNMGMKQAAFEQFARAGIIPGNIVDNPADTTTDSTYFSYSEFLKGNRAIDADFAVIVMIPGQ